MRDYVLLRAVSAIEMEGYVNQKRKDGYILLGNISVTPYNGYLVYAQAMGLPDKQTEEKVIESIDYPKGLL